MEEKNLAYIAGLFDGEGHIQYKQYMRQRKHNIRPYPTWSIRMEMAMTDQSILIWVWELELLERKDIRQGIRKLGKNNGVGDVVTVMLITFLNFYGLLLT